MCRRLLHACGFAMLFSCAGGIEEPDPCDILAREYMQEAFDAGSCDPAAAEPCAAYLGGTTIVNPGCVFVGLDPTRIATLDKIAQDYRDEACDGGVFPPCPAVVAPAFACLAATADTYACQRAP